MSTLSSIYGGGIKSIQRGSTLITAGTLTTNVTISAVDLSKTFVSSSCQNGTAGPTSSNRGDFAAGGTLTSTTNLRVTRGGLYGSTASSTPGSFEWEVVEYV